MGNFMYILLPLNILFCFYCAYRLFLNSDKKSGFTPLTAVFLTNGLCAYLEFQIINVVHPETIRVYALNHLVTVVWIIYFAIIGSISFGLSDKKQSWLIKSLNLIATLPIIFLSYTFIVQKNLTHVNLAYIKGQWLYNLDFSNPVGFIFITFICTGLIIIGSFYWKRFYKLKKENKKLRIIIFGLIQTFSAIIAVFFFLVQSKDNLTPFFASPIISVNAVFITWIFMDFQLAKISTNIAYNDILNSMSNILILTNQQFEIEHINKEGIKIFNLTKEEIFRTPFHKLIRKLKAKNWQSIAEIIRNGSKSKEDSAIVEIIVKGKNYFINVNIKPYYSNGNKLVGYIFLGNNVTELNEQKLEIQKHTKVLERTNIELERFAYIASHDLKTPLRSVVSFLDLIERKMVKYEDKDLKEFVYMARQGATQMHHLIKDILEFSKVGKTAMTLESIDLNETLMNICHQLQPKISDKKGVLQVSHLPLIRAEKTHMLQLFTNLIENGFKYNEHDLPQVKINHRFENNRHIFAISDNGIGVEKRYFDQIFEMFKRLHTNPNHEGSGIGLSICKKIVDFYQGEIWLESKPNEGTTFFFTLAEEEELAV